MFTNDFVTLNDGVTPTFQGAQGSSFPDLTLCPTKEAAKIKNWKVLDEEENLSDHHCIEFTIELKDNSINTPRRINMRPPTARVLTNSLKQHFQENGPPQDTDALYTALKEAYRAGRSTDVYRKRKNPVKPKY